MSKPPQKYGQHFDVEDAFGNILDTASRVALWGGLVAILIAVGLLLATYSAFAGAQPPGSIDQALNNVDMLQKLLIVGSVAAVVGTTYMFWGEETLGAFQLAFAAILWFAPLYVPSILGGGGFGGVSRPGAAALAAIQLGGTIIAGIALCVLIVDIAGRVRQRAIQGTKADQLKLGKGMKEEKDIKNVLMGRCWQLPYCRKFVRERCPIYHSRRTCWKERVGCMCEEEVIRNAMENKVVPKDMVAAARYIPYNNKIPMEAKKERCRQCVIYNEHQKHKYRVALPMTVIGFGAIYVLLREPLLGMTGNIIGSFDKVFANLTFQKGGAITTKVQNAPLPFAEVLLICFMIVGLAYTLKMLEYVIFKLKA